MGRIKTIADRLLGEETPLGNEIRIEQALHFSRGTPTMALGIMVNSALAAIIAGEKLPLEIVASWVAVIWLVFVLRLLRWRHTRMRPRPKRMGRKTLRRIILWSTLTGLLWGSAAVAVGLNGTLQDQVLIAFVIAIQVAGAAAWLFPITGAFLGYMSASVLPLCIVLVLRGGTVRWAIALMTIALALSMTHFVWGACQRFIARIADALEQNTLLQAVASSREELEVRVSDRTAELVKINARLNREVQERAHIEQVLRDSEEKFRHVVEGSIQGIMVQRDSRLVFCNKAFWKMFGYESMAEMQALPSVDGLVAPEYREQMMTYRAARLRGETPPPTYEFRGIHKSGERLWLRVSNSVIEWEGAPAVQSIMIDITESIALEEQLRHAQKIEAVGQLAGGVAHDFNNVLQAIIGYTTLALQQTPEDGPVRPYLELSLNTSRRGARLTNQLLAFSRQEVLAPELLDLSTLVTAQSSLLQRLIGENFELSLDTPAGHAWVVADSGLMEQVVVNLCINARDAMPDGGCISVDVSPITLDAAFCQAHESLQPGPYVRLRVADTGVGVAPEIRDRIFDPFFTTKEVGQGTGLGLSMVYGIVQQHAGIVLLESPPEGGSVFSVYLPAAQAPAKDEIPLAALTQAKAQQQGTETILVAEDDAAVRRLTQQLLEDAGYSTLAAKDGAEAMALFEQQRNTIDLLLLDMVMPSLNGRMVHERIRAQAPNLPVIFVSGYTADKLDAQYISENKLGLLRKPYVADALLSLVRETLDRR